jgi:hypothetical protein
MGALVDFHVNGKPGRPLPPAGVPGRLRGSRRGVRRFAAALASFAAGDAWRRRERRAAARRGLPPVAGAGDRRSVPPGRKEEEPRERFASQGSGQLTSDSRGGRRSGGVSAAFSEAADRLSKFRDAGAGRRGWRRAGGPLSRSGRSRRPAHGPDRRSPEAIDEAMARLETIAALKAPKSVEEILAYQDRRGARPHRRQEEALRASVEVDAPRPRPHRRRGSFRRSEAAGAS